MNIVYETQNCKLICDDSISALQQMDDESIDCCVTSPPYYNLRDYGCDGQIGLEETPEEYIKNLIDVFKEVKRVLRDDGTLWVNIGDCYAGGGRGSGYSIKQDSNRGTLKMPRSKVPIQCKRKDLIGIPWMLAFALRADGWYLRQDIIWHKPNAMPESVTDRCTRSHEYIFMLSKNERYYYDHDAIKEKCSNGDPDKPRCSIANIEHLNSGRRKQNELGKQTYTGFNDRYFSKPPLTTRNKRSVWSITTKPIREAHFATFPIDLIEPCILAGCQKGGIVLDPFSGSGTTGVAALKNFRKSVLIDINANYCKIAVNRLRKHECIQSNLFVSEET